MSAATRLWRRAPLWRLSLGAALTFTALTALYPPPQLTQTLSRLATLAARTQTRSDPTTTVATAPPLDQPPQHGTFRIAGRVLPLPPGDWRTILAARYQPGQEVSEIVLARIAQGRLTGLIDAAGTTTQSTQTFGLARDCLDPLNDVTHIVPLDGRKDKDARECWLIRPASPRPHTIGQAALDRLRENGVDLGPPSTRAAWFRTGAGEFLSVFIDLPGTTLVQAQTWMAVFAKRLSRAFDATA